MVVAICKLYFDMEEVHHVFMGEDLHTVRSLFSELSIFQTHHLSQDWSTDLFRQVVLHQIESLLHLEYSKAYN